MIIPQVQIARERLQAVMRAQMAYFGRNVKRDASADPSLAESA